MSKLLLLLLLIIDITYLLYLLLGDIDGKWMVGPGNLEGLFQP